MGKLQKAFILLCIIQLTLAAYENFTLPVKDNSSVQVLDSDDAGDVEVLLKGFQQENINNSSAATEEAIEITPDGTSSRTTTMTAVTESSTTRVDSTTTATSTKATTVATTKKPVKRKPVSNKRRVCGCDLHIHTCDMNCCCDIDCNLEEKKLFSYCINSGFYDPTISSSKSHSCFRTNIFYRENSPYSIRETNRGLFCVVSENIETSDELPPEPSNIDLKYLAQKRPKFSWEFLKQGQPVILRESYRFASVLIKVTANPSGIISAGPFDIPAVLYEKSCDASESVKFLNPVRTSCVRKITDMEKLCTKQSNLDVNYFINNAAFISNPSSENFTDSIVPLTFASCNKQGVGKSCTLTTILDSPAWDRNTKTCKNALQDLDITFFHVGIEGINEVVVKATLVDISSSVTKVIQEFSVDFLWDGSTVNSDDSENSTTVKTTKKSDQINLEASDYPRSGNPGYIVGRPVLMGRKVLRVSENNLTVPKKETKEEAYENEDSETETEKNKEDPSEQEGIALDSNPENWMTIHNPGICSSQRRSNVKFGLLHQTECLLNVSEPVTCESLQEEITTTLIGFSPSNFTQMFVSSFGNPDLDDMTEWVPVLLSGLTPNLGKDGSVSSRQGCDGIVATLKIKIAYAYVGPIRFPQAKITGVLYEFGDSFSIPRKVECGKNDGNCLKYNHHVSLITSVVFIDVTKEPVPRIGQWPVVSIKLPADFFYPFSTTSGSYRLYSTVIHMIICGSLLLYCKSVHP